VYSATDATEFEELQKVTVAGIQTERTSPMPTILDMLVEQRAEQICAVASKKAHDLGLERGIEQGIEQGIETGRTAGILIGQIRTLEQVFQLPVTPETELNPLFVEELRLRLERVQAATSRVGNG
jgi:flagellar biosynthesis/type III secretory pathway protein FliH